MPSAPHPSSEGMINFSHPTPLAPEQRARAKAKFYHIVDRFKEQGTANKDKYNRALLLRYTFEYARSEESRDIFLQAFFQSLALSIDSESDLDFADEEQEQQLLTSFSSFADYLVDYFFLPVMASSKQTPQPTPIFQPAMVRAQGDQVGSSDRVAALQGDCLIRDRHRCVISRTFHAPEALSRYEADGQDLRDDDGQLLANGACQFEDLRVAHILPQSLTETGPDSTELSPQKKTALAILNMLDYGILELINGSEMDRPRNAISLTTHYRYLLGDFVVYFTPQDGPDDPPHTYKIDTFFTIMRGHVLPATRTLFLTEDQTIEPPEPRFLALHRAIAHILHLSGARYHIHDVIEKFEMGAVQADGSTELGKFVELRLGGW